MFQDFSIAGKLAGNEWLLWSTVGKAHLLEWRTVRHDCELRYTTNQIRYNFIFLAYAQANILYMMIYTYWGKREIKLDNLQLIPAIIVIITNMKR